MATNTWIKVSGVWKEAINVWAKVGGVWKKDVIPKGNVGGVWKEFKTYSSAIVDSFNRANASTLGSTETGQVWQFYGANNVWGIQNNQAYPITPVWDLPVYFDAGISENVAMQVKIAVVENNQQIMWRIVDNLNFYCLQDNTIYKIVDGNWLAVDAIAHTLINGDILRVELGITKQVIKVNGVQKFIFYDDSHVTGTKFGFSCRASQGLTIRLDDFLVENI